MTTEHPGLRLDAVVEWLAAAGVMLEPPVSPRLLTAGRSNVSYLLTDATGASVVLRRPPLGNVMPTAHDMAREHRVLTGLAHVDFPAPRPLALCEDADVNDSPFLVMEFVDGRIVATAEQAQSLSAGEREAVSHALVETLARLHSVDVAAAGLADFGRPEGYLPRQLVRWTKQWELTQTRPLPAMDALRDRLGTDLSRLPDDQPSGLVHGDYRLDNVMLATDGADVRAVLDWEMSTLGHPLADLGLTLVYWTEPADVLRSRIPVAERLTDAPGFLDRRRFIDAYADASGLPMDVLDTCTALACLKLAVITESILARTLMGKQLGVGSEHAHAMGVATESLAELGLHVLESGTVDGLNS